MDNAHPSITWKYCSKVQPSSSYTIWRAGDCEVELQGSVNMSKKGDKEKPSNHNSSVQLLSWVCESEETLFHKLFCITTKYFEQKIFVFQNIIQKLKKNITL